MELHDFKNVSETVKRLNPHIFDRAAVDRLPAAHRQCVDKKALVGEPPREKACGKGGAESAQPIVRVVLVSFRGRATDSDNDTFAAKGIRDELAKWIGLDDGSPLIEWEYQRVISPKHRGILVKIDLLLSK